MRLAIIYWPTSSVGGIATHLNAIRRAAIRAGDECDILLSASQKTKKPHVFDERKWVRGGDTRIWIDGEAPHHPDNVADTITWLEKNYDAIYFGFLCPHPTKAYPTPDFLPLFTDTSCSLAGGITDGYWNEYKEWGRQCLPFLNVLTSSGLNYAVECEPDATEVGLEILNLGMPFEPQRGKYEKKSKAPLMVWPNQWKNIKGINGFLDAVPAFPKKVKVELYSCGIRYYQLRTEERWKKAVSIDHFKQFDGDGRAPYFGNVDYPVIRKAFQRAWFTANFQGITSRKEAYKKGSYNNTELEALFYGAHPFLHESTLQTDLPKACYTPLASPDLLPNAIAKRLRVSSAKVERERETARSFVIQNYSSARYYDKLRKYL